jgi:DNA-binding transcriptional ArsR family regulator
MKEEVRLTLLHLLFPMVRAEILRLLFTNPRQELYVRQLARLSSLSLHTVQEELAKLYTAELLLSRSNGYHRFYRANPKHRLYMTLRRLVIKTAPLAKPRVSRRRRRAVRPG